MEELGFKQIKTFSNNSKVPTAGRAQTMTALVHPPYNQNSTDT